MSLKGKALLRWAIFLLTFTAAAWAQGAYRDVPELPEGVAGERIRELIDVLNADDGERTRAFVQDRFTPEFRDMVPMERHLGIFADVYRQSRGLDFYGVREYEGEAPVEGLAVIVRNRLTESWMALVVHLEPAPPHRFAGLQFAPARPPSDLPPPAKLSDEEIVSELDAFVRRLAAEDVFSGSCSPVRGPP